MTADVLRVIAGGILALVSSYIGYLVKKSYGDKVTFFKDMTEFVESLKRDMTFLRTPITTFCDIYVKDKKGKAAELIREYSTELKLKGKFDREVDKWDFAHLKRDEKEELICFFSTLGKTPIGEQLSLLEKSRDGFRSREQMASEELKKKGNMYFKLFALLGVALMVILW